MTLTVRDDFSVHVTIDSGQALGPEARAIIGSDEVKGIYRDQMAGVFGSVENLSITASPTLLVTFDTKIVNADGGRYTIESRDFGGNLDDVSTLKVELPQGYRFVSSDVTPDRIESNSVFWENQQAIPEIIFEEKNKGVCGPILLILLAPMPFLVKRYLLFLI